MEWRLSYTVDCSLAWELNRVLKMKAGDAEGLHAIYDESGGLILAREEHLVRKSEGDNIDIWKGKHGLFSKTLLPRTKEKGTLYVTNKRLVFIREPDPHLYYKTYSDPFSLPEGLAGSRYANSIRKLGLRIYAEISFDEVTSLKSHPKGKWIEIHLKDDDGIPIRADIYRLNNDDDKIPILEALLIEAGAEKVK